MIYYDSDAAVTSLGAGSLLINQQKQEKIKQLYQSLRRQQHVLECKIENYTELMLELREEEEKGNATEISNSQYVEAIKKYDEFCREKKEVNKAMDNLLKELKSNGADVEHLKRLIEAGDSRSRAVREEFRNRRKLEAQLENTQNIHVNDAAVTAPIRYRIGSNVFEQVQQPGQTVANNRTGSRSTVPSINCKKEGSISFEVDIF